MLLLTEVFPDPLEMTVCKDSELMVTRYAKKETEESENTPDKLFLKPRSGSLKLFFAEETHSDPWRAGVRFILFGKMLIPFSQNTLDYCFLLERLNSILVIVIMSYISYFANV